MSDLSQSLTSYFKLLGSVQTDPALLYLSRKEIKDSLRRYPTQTLDELSTLVDTMIDIPGYSLIKSLIDSCQVELSHGSTPLETDTTAISKINHYLNQTYGDYIYYKDNTLELQNRSKWLKIISGNPLTVTIKTDKDCDIVEYGDHVTRMQALSQHRPERLHQFIVPKWRPQTNLFTPITSLKPVNLDSILQDNLDIPIHRQPLKGFNYNYLETDEMGANPIKLRLPNQHKRAFNLNADGEFMTTENVLHMPIKLSTAVADNLNRDGRCLANGRAFDDHTLYIPDEIAESQDVLDLIYYNVAIEHQLDPERLRNNMILLTLRVEDLLPGTTLGQSGWHVDGHQGAERLQMNGEKVEIDRTYCISNTLSTQVTDMRLNLEPVKQRAKQDGLTLDQYNLQDIIQKSVISAEQEANRQNKTIITEVGDNVLFYANPYMIHQSRTNTTTSTVKRSFYRLLFTRDERDRIGDTISPIIGPCYPFKIKNVTDIQQLPLDVQVTGKICSSFDK